MFTVTNKTGYRLLIYPSPRLSAEVTAPPIILQLLNTACYFGAWIVSSAERVVRVSSLGRLVLDGMVLSAPESVRKPCNLIY
jgi:hypothetical protein